MGIDTIQIDNNIADEIENGIGVILNNTHLNNTSKENDCTNILIDIKSDNNKIIIDDIFEYLDNKQQEINNFQLFKDSVFKIINENKDNCLWKKYNLNNELREYIIFLQTQYENEINVNNIQNFKDIESVTTVFLNKIKNNKYNKKDFKVDLFEDLNYIKNRLNNEENLTYSSAGGLVLEGLTEALIKSINGSYSNILGLPLYDVRNMFVSAGIM